MTREESLEIVPFAPHHGCGVVGVILPIQREEFELPITLEDQPDLRDIPGFYQKRAGNFWVALAGGEIVGTIALLDIGNRQGALRKMFVAASHRGAARGVAAELLETLLDWCRERGVDEIFLGTTAKYLAAHRFYEKNGFAEIEVDDLPEAFPIMAVDTKFYRRSVALLSESLHAETLSRRLVDESFPRLQMLLLVSLAGLGAFLCSFALLRAGLESMGWRYLVATAAGYLSFMGSIRLWIAYQRGAWQPDLDPGLDLDGGGDLGGPEPPGFSGDGGTFGGAGASDSVGAPLRASADISGGVDLDELGLVLLAAAACLVGVIVVGSVVYASPALLAEVLLDAAVVGAAYRSARRRKRSHWAAGVLRRTWWRALVLCASLSAAGFLLQAYAPQAHSLGDVVRAIREK